MRMADRDSAVQTEPQDLSSCKADCASEGATQCTSDGLQQTCTSVAGCLQWSTPLACDANQLCCSGLCVPADEQNCWACGITCGGTTPSCSANSKRCVCTPEACAPTQHDCDPNFGICVACESPPVPETRSDFYVDGKAVASPTGSLGCPYPTIGAALAPAGSSSAAMKTVHIAAGTYGANEVFPIIVRNGISLAGAGASTTTIQGQGSFNAHAEFSQLDYTVQTTILIGSDGAGAAPAQTLSGVTLIPSPAPPANSYGVICDRGNAVPRTSPSPSPAPNVTLKGLTIGPGFSIGVIDTNSHPSAGAESACNLLVVGSTFTGLRVGIWALGAGLNNLNDSSHDVALQVGDGSATGANHFTNIHDPNGTGYPFGGGANGALGVNAWDGVSPCILWGNTFDSSDAGVSFSEHPNDHLLRMVGNTLSGLGNYGVIIGNSAVLDMFSGNVISGVGGGPGTLSGFGHCALCMGSNTNQTGSTMRKARNNQLVGNEVGVEVSGNGITAARTMDFGTAADPGGNTFSCNSNGTNGADVYFHLSSASDATVLQMVGNSWDHAVPSTTSADGSDILVTAPVPTFATSPTAAVAAACTGGHSP